MRYYVLIILILLINQFELTIARDQEYWADEQGSEDYHGAGGNSQEETPTNGQEDDHGHDHQDEHVDQPPEPVVIQHEDSPRESSDTTISPCRLQDLVKCLTEPLDEWAISLYELKENIVSIKPSECLGPRELIRQCIEERAWNDFQCDHANILSVSARITDLLVHKEGSGNWLRSYYVTAYVCTPIGNQVRNHISDTCLKQERIGQMTFEAVKYMDEQLSNNHTATNKERCDYLRKRSLMMMDIGRQKCPDDSHHGNASLLMCETIKMAFLKMHPEMFDNGDHKCEFVCEIKKDEAVSGATSAIVPPEQAPEPGKPDANHAEPKPTHDTGAANGMRVWWCSSVSVALMARLIGQLLRRTV